MAADQYRTKTDSLEDEVIKLRVIYAGHSYTTGGDLKFQSQVIFGNEDGGMLVAVSLQENRGYFKLFDASREECQADNDHRQLLNSDNPYSVELNSVRSSSTWPAQKKSESKSKQKKFSVHAGKPGPAANQRTAHNDDWDRSQFVSFDSEPAV